MLTKNDLQQIKALIDPVNNRLTKISKDLDRVINHFDGRLTKVEKDV